MPSKTKDTFGRLVKHWGTQRKRGQYSSPTVDADVLDRNNIDGLYWDEPSSNAIFSKVDGSAVISKLDEYRVETH
jgi:hypothetical protein